MPLSEEELRLLEQMERALVEEDPKFASTLRGTTQRRSARRRAMAAGGVLVVGVVVMMTGAVAQQAVVGIIGFVIMLGAATVGLGALRQQPAAPAGDQGRTAHGMTVFDGGRAGKAPKARRGARGPAQGRPSKTSRSSAPFMQRMEERWRRRKEQGGGF